MRTFKIIVITLLLLGLATGALYLLKGYVTNGEAGPGPGYHEDEQETEDDIYSRQMKQLEGTVKILGISIYQEGTHRLEADDKLVALLESKKINLPDFEGQEVKVRGFVRDTVEGAQKIMEVQYIEPVSEAGVKLFNDVGYEFSFSYPADWEVSKEADKVTFARKNGDVSENLIVVYQFEDVKESLEVWLKNRDQNLFYEEAKVKVGEVDGVRRTVKNGDQAIIKTYLKAGKNAYEIRLLSQEEVILNQYFSIVDFFKTNFQDEVLLEEEEKTDSEEEQPVVSEYPADQREDVEEMIVTPDENSEAQEADTSESSESYSKVDPLSSEQIQKVLEKGFLTYAGKTLSFDYPKIWYFSYLGNGKYGMTDDVTYKVGEEVTEENSRVILVIGFSDVSCSAKVEKTLESTAYTVCAREPGLGEIIEHIAESISKPE